MKRKKMKGVQSIDDKREDISNKPITAIKRKTKCKLKFDENL